MFPIRIIIMDDDPDCLDIFNQLISRDPRLEVVGVATNGEEGIDLYRETLPDITVMNYRMPLKNGIEASLEILSYNPDAKIILFSALREVEDSARKIGVSAFVYTLEWKDLIPTIFDLYLIPTVFDLLGR